MTHEKPLWTITISAHCSTLIAEGYGCMAELTEGCTALATGHVQVDGGPYDGSVVVVVCAEHIGNPDNIDAVRAVLAQCVTAGFLDLHTGGPGPLGYPRVRHGDHIDELKASC